MEFAVEYSEEKDINVYLNALYNKDWTDYGTNYHEISKKYYPIEFLENIKNSNTIEDARQVVSQYFKSTRNQYYLQSSEFVAKWFTKFLNEEQKLITGKLEKVFQQTFPFEKITVYLNSFYTNPYNYDEKWYMVGRDYNFWGLLKTSTHELNHFMFFYYHQEDLIKRGYNKSQIDHLKESLAVLTSNNPEKENEFKPNVLPIQKFVYENKDNSVDKIIELEIQNKLLENIT